MIGFYMKCNTGLKWVKELIFNVLKNWLHKCLLATIYWRHKLLDGDILLWHYQLPFCLETFAERHSAQGLWENFKKFNLMKNSCYEVKNSIKCTCEFFKMYYLYQLASSVTGCSSPVSLTQLNLSPVWTTLLTKTMKYLCFWVFFKSCLFN